MRSTRSSAAGSSSRSGGTYDASFTQAGSSHRSRRPRARPAPRPGARRLRRRHQRRIAAAPLVLRHAQAGRDAHALVPHRAVEPRPRGGLERDRLADRARHLPGPSAVRARAGSGRHGTRPLPRHRGPEHRERRHLRRRHGVHVQAAGGRQVPAAGQSRGHGGRLQVQLRAHDERAPRPCDVLLHGRRRRRQVHEGQGRRDHRLQGGGRPPPSRSRSRARTSPSSTR